MPSENQIGIMGEREPQLCAVSGRPIRGKHTVTHYQGDNVHYVRVLNQFDHLWPQAAAAYGFPVPQEGDTQDNSDVFVLDDSLNENVPVYDALTGQAVASFQANSDNPPIPSSLTPIAPARPKTPKADTPSATNEGDL